jgi:hypothetical protein
MKDTGKQKNNFSLYLWSTIKFGTITKRNKINVKKI